MPEHDQTPSGTDLPGLTADTLGEMFGRTAQAFADRPALRSADGTVELTWEQYAQRSGRIAAALSALGIQPGHVVASLLSNRVEFHLVDVAVLRLGAAPFSIYPTAPPEQLRHQLADSGATVLFTERALLPLARAAGGVTLIVVDGDGASEVNLEQLENRASVDLVPALGEAVADPAGLANLIYTSGTTGPAKGVELTHANLINTVRGIHTALGLRPGGRTVSYLPHAHLADRTAAHYSALAAGTCITCVSDPREVMAVIARERPTHFLAVPRIWEKLHAALLAGFAADPDPDRRAEVAEALDAATAKIRAEQAGGPVGESLARKVARYDRTVLAGIREQIGCDHLDFAYTGAAPIRADVHEFFLALGLRVCECWGMTETTVMGTLCRPDAIRVGTVGTPLPGVELRLAADGEILLRGPNIMRGYRNLPERTAEVLDPDGWLATGDIGRVDADGYVTIIDRKKEIIINSAGKNMSPANIEAKLKSASPLIGQACCIGDARPYNVALLVLDADGCATYASDHSLTDSSPASLADDAAVRAELEAAVERANAQLARVEQIKRFTVLTAEWQPGGDELTPTMKLKRKPIAARYSTEIDALYDSRP